MTSTFLIARGLAADDASWDWTCARSSPTAARLPASRCARQHE